MKNFLIAGMLLAGVDGFAQDDSTRSALTISGYLEGYYTYDLARPSSHNRPSFIYSHNRHNEVNLNLGFIKAAYQKSNVRANFALAAGTYMNANYVAEPGVLKNIYEANAGVKISRHKELWIDAGVFSSHLGFESAIGKDNWTLTRSLFAENSPYFETGAKLSYTTDNRKWLVSGLVLNGWQRIQRADGNNTPAFGHQVTYKPNSRVTLNSSSFIGNDKPDSIRQLRYFHNLYGIFQLTDQLGITAGLDIGAEQKAKGSRSYNTWYTPVMVIKLSPAPRHSISARGEYYQDKNGVIIATDTPDGFKTWGYSLNYDFLVLPDAMWRVEARGFSSKDKIFVKDNEPSYHNYFITTSIAVAF